MKVALFLFLTALAGPGLAQTAPGLAEIAAYQGLHRAAADNDADAVRALAAAGADLNARDNAGRTPAHVATFAGAADALTALAAAGADMNALDGEAYDPVTIAAVADDPDLMALALSLGNRPDLVTSRWDGTALIAAAHLGHDQVVRRLIAAGAPLDHVNNLGWTALIEAVVLGDGGPRHQAVVKALVDAGADRSLADRDGQTPLMLAQARGHSALVSLLSAA